jgi:uncharacterized YccA/Bax inhibitor family protein
MELIFMGLRYSKYILIVSLVIFDIILLFEKGSIDILKYDYLKILFGLQSFSLLLYLLYNTISIKICFNFKRQFDAKDVGCLLLLNLCTISAFFIGSIFGFFRKNGIFYRTARN